MANLAVSFRTPSWISEFELSVKIANGAAMAGRAAVNFAANISDKIPTSLQNFSKSTQLLNSVAVVIALPKIVGQIRETATTKNAVERVEKGWRVATLIAGATFNSMNTISAMKTLKWMDSARFSWVSKISPFAFPLLVVGLFFTTRQFGETQEFYKEMKGKIKPISGTSKEEKSAEIADACEIVVANSARIIKQCKIGSNARIEEKAQAILNRIKGGDDTALKDGEKFLDAMRGRIRLTYRLELAGVVSSIGAVAAGGLTANIPTPVTLGFAVVAYTASFVHTIAAEVLYRQNPVSKINI
jgi:hypothetical protein